MDDEQQMQASPAQQQHMAAMQSFMSALDEQRDRAAMASYRTQALQPGTAMVGGAGAAGSMARAAMLGGPRAMLMSAMRHPQTRLTMLGHGGPPMKQMPMPQATAGGKAASFLHTLGKMKLMQRVGQGEKPQGAPMGAAVHAMDPSTSSYGL